MKTFSLNENCTRSRPQTCSCGPSGLYTLDCSSFTPTKPCRMSCWSTLSCHQHGLHPQGSQDTCKCKGDPWTPNRMTGRSPPSSSLRGTGTRVFHPHSTISPYNQKDKRLNSNPWYWATCHILLWKHKRKANIARSSHLGLKPIMF